MEMICSSLWLTQHFSDGQSCQQSQRIGLTNAHPGVPLSVAHRPPHGLTDPAAPKGSHGGQGSMDVHAQTVEDHDLGIPPPSMVDCLVLFRR